MSRLIDRLPEPKEKKKLKLIVASQSRSGTLGLYEALKILGYKPYHMYEVVTLGTTHMEITREALLAHYNHFLGIKRYARPEFDKWFGEYDVVVEVASWLHEDVLQAYVNDPDVKFILTERDADKWAKSFDNTCGEVVNGSGSFPANILKYFNNDIFSFFRLNRVIYQCMADGFLPGQPESQPALSRTYKEYITMAKRVLPAERTLHLRLEDGLGWDKICPFLGLPVPDAPYPANNIPAEFKAKVMEFMTPRMQSAMMKFGALAVTTIGAVALGTLKYGPTVRAALNA